MLKNKFLLYLKFLALILLVFFNTSSAEYILFKKVNDEMLLLNNEEYNKALDVVMKWKFPMALNNLEEIQNLSEDELKHLCDDEKGFIEKRLLELELNDIGIKYIPTILYEVIVLGSNFKEDLKKLPTIWIKPSDKLTYEIDSLHRNDYLHLLLKNLDYLEFLPDNVKLPDYLNLPDNANHKDLRPLKFEINNEILNLILSYKNDTDSNNLGLYNPSLFKEYFKALFAITYKSFIYDANDGFCPEITSLKFNLDEIADKLYNMMLEEEEAYDTGSFLIYRGSSKFQDSLKKTLEKSSFQSGGISYGNTLFAGFLNDYDACAFPYMFDINFYVNSEAIPPFIKKTIVGYVVSINKFEYLKINSDLRELFFIPPVDTLIGLIAAGEYFHTRAFDILPIDLSTQDFSKQILFKQERFFCEYLAKNAQVKTYIYLVYAPNKVSFDPIPGHITFPLEPNEKGLFNLIDSNKINSKLIILELELLDDESKYSKDENQTYFYKKDLNYKIFYDL